MVIMNEGSTTAVVAIRAPEKPACEGSHDIGNNITGRFDG